MSVILSLLICLFWTVNVYSSELFKSRVSIEGLIVSSSCNVEIQSDSSINGLIDFGQYNLSNREGLTEKLFFVKIFEDNSTVPGCSAFLSGNGLVVFRFGDKFSKQLDEYGVVTRGAGGGIRIAIKSLDSEASHNQKVTSKNDEIKYPVNFAQKGVFKFSAQLERLESALSGEYHGTLSLVVSYQ